MMKTHWKRWSALFCALVLALGSALSAMSASSAETVYFTAVNDTLLSLTAGAMPILSDGVYYVPYTALDASSTGSGLGVYTSRNTAKNLVLVYSRKRTVTFDLSGGPTVDSEGLSFTARAITRNSMVYLPLAWTCFYFGITYNLLDTDYGTLIRIKSDSVVLSDSQFLDAAKTAIRRRYLTYESSLSGGSSSSPAVSPSSPSSSASPSPSPSTVPEETTLLSLAVRCDSGDPASMLSALESAAVPAVFFFPKDTLAANDDLIRRLLGSGYQVGLLITSSTREEALSEYEEGCSLLAEIARFRPRMVLAADSNVTGALTDAGCAIWHADVTGSAENGETLSAQVRRIRRAVSKGGERYLLELSDSQRSAQALNSLFSQLSGSLFRWSAVYATDF